MTDTVEMLREMANGDFPGMTAGADTDAGILAVLMPMRV